MIEVNERINVPALSHAVWQLLSDPRAVVDCVPGATLVPRASPNRAPMMIDMRISRSVTPLPYRRIHYGKDE